MNPCKPHVLALLAILSLASAQAAHADGNIPAAEEHLAELRFEEAKELAQGLLSKGKNDPQDLGRLYMVLGRVAASLGEDSEAIAMFHNALSIDASLRLPDGVSPKLSDPFATAQARLEGATPIAIGVQQLDDGLLVVTVDSDPANLVGGAQVDYKLKGKSKTLRGTGRSTIEIVVPKAARALEVTALDMHGNRLTATESVDSTTSKPSVEVSTAKPSPGKPGVPVYERWEIYAGATGVAMLGGLYLGKTADDAASKVGTLENGTEFSVAKALEDKAKSRALYANISFAAAGILGAAAVWMYTRDGDGEPETLAKSAMVVPTVSRDGLGIGASLRF